MSPPTVENVSAIYTDAHEVSLTWTQDAEHTAYILRQDADGGWRTVGRGQREVSCSFMDDHAPERARYIIAFNTWHELGDNVWFGPYAAMRVVYVPMLYHYSPQISEN